MRILLALLSFAVTSAISGLFFMFASWHLHSNYWDSIPALGFWHAFVVSLMFSALFSMDGVTNTDANKENPLFYILPSFVILPILLFITVNYLNGNVFPTMPDISYGTAFVLGLMALPFQFANWMLKIFSEDLVEG